MHKWIKYADQKPRTGQNVIAVGTWVGEIGGTGESEYMCLGEYQGGYVAIDSDTDTTIVKEITHWMPIPAHPED